jgi:hypothetical protein
MRVVLFCLGVLAAGSLLEGEATAQQFVPGPSFLGDLGDTGFVTTNAFPYTASGNGFQGNAGVGMPGAMMMGNAGVGMPGAMMGNAGVGLPNGTMGNPDLTDQQRQTLSNVRQRLPRNPYGLRRAYYPAQAAPNPAMQHMPYPQSFQYTPQIQDMQLPQYVPQTQFIGGSSINPHLHFTQQPQFILTLPLITQPAQ